MDIKEFLATFKKIAEKYYKEHAGNYKSDEYVISVTGTALLNGPVAVFTISTPGSWPGPKFSVRQDIFLEKGTEDIVLNNAGKITDYKLKELDGYFRVIN